ncbi:MAG: 4-alpha-glucanotransferase [Kiloniellaceae bacterium]
MNTSPLEKLSEALGILPHWHDLAGNLHTTGPETQRALLSAMGCEVATEAEAAEALAEHDHRAGTRRLPEEIVLTAGDDHRLNLTAPAEWHLELETGEVRSGSAEEFIDIAPPAGLHRLCLGDETCLIIAAPPQAPGVADMLGHERAWGVTAALYALRSSRNLGIGDYADLATAAAQMAGLGAAFIGINPVHARGAACTGISPYTPSCRTAFEPRHIAVDAVPGFASSVKAQRLLHDNTKRLEMARSGGLVDYAAAESIASPVLRAVFEDVDPVPGGPSDDFAAWRAGDGEALEWYALFEAVSLVHGADWRGWPEPLQAFGSQAVLDFAAGNGAELRYHAWLQWLAARQIAAAQAAAKRAGMGFGLYLDVAVGVRPGGADTWSAPDCFVEAVSLGAPPDAFNPSGQTWALSPFDPAGLRAAGYRPFIEMLRSAMRHAGIIRIDHILGLRRSFWVPENGAPGGYVAYPLEPLLALIRLEAQRTGCVVVGEDLGSVPPGLRDRLAQSGLLGCAVVQFEKEGHRFHPPSAYRPATIASFGTHDTPTLRGWWSGWDIDQRHDIAGGSAAARQAEHRQRADERAALARLLKDEGLAPANLDPTAPPPEADDGIAVALHGMLAAAGSGLVAVQLDDAIGSVAQQNLPGTIDEHPNWRRRYPVATGALADDPGLRAVARLLSPSEKVVSGVNEAQPCP